MLKMTEFCPFAIGGSFTAISSLKLKAGLTSFETLSSTQVAVSRAVLSDKSSVEFSLFSVFFSVP